MTPCLSDAQLQAIVDSESPREDLAHVQSCSACAGRLAVLRDRTARSIAAADTITLDAGRRAVARARLNATASAGATTLRHDHRAPIGGLWLTAASAAAALLLMAVIRMAGGSTTVSAAEVLDRSRAALAEPVSGVEVLTYDLAIDGVLTQIVPDEHAGRFTVEERIDHDRPGRYRLVKLSDNRVVAGATDDPVSRTRTRYLRAHGRGYLLQFVDAEPGPFSALAIKRFALQTLITLMQASGSKTLQHIERDGVALYQIEISEAARSSGGMWGLSRARALIAADDARLIECYAEGFIADQPFQLDFVLRSREVLPGASVSDADFAIAAEPGDVVLQGKASSNPMWDVVQRALSGLQPSVAK